MNEPCMCGHNKNEHVSEAIPGYNTQVCLDPITRLVCECYNFKLDNLKLIEDMAKEKGLI
jgi:hypothetical protein